MTMQEAPSSAAASRADASTWPGTPITFVAALYLLATGRWGAYVGLPGLPVYVGEMLVLLAAAQVAVVARRSTRSGSRFTAEQPPFLVLLVCCLLGWAFVRFVLSAGSVMDAPLTALRDVAPYAYAVVAVLSFILPTVDNHRHRALVYAALALHVAWILLPRWLPNDGFLADIVLGGAPIFTTRPDIDSAVLGIGIALALHDLLVGRGDRLSGQHQILLIALIVASTYAVTTQATRAGLLACAVTSLPVLALWIAGAGLARRRNRILAVVAGLVVVAGVVLISPLGARLVDGLTSGSSQAAGTIKVREDTWGGVAEYVSASAVRTGVGVGFGPDFVDASGTSYALEGTEYKDVRSPHNYLVGTLARLGVAGALLAACVLVLGFYAAWRVLAAGAGTTTTFAALVLLAVPVTALLGVVLESPFGAIPYFWALGQVTAWQVRTSKQ